MSLRPSTVSLHYQEFIGRFAQVGVEELESLFDGIRSGLFKKNEIRVWAARIELLEQPVDGKVTLNRIINRKGNRLLKPSEIDKAGSVLDAYGGRPQTNFHIKVSRRGLRIIATGQISKNEACVLLIYFFRRMPQRKRLKILNPGERYARITYREVNALSGMTISSACIAANRLISKSLLESRRPAQQNINDYGLVFVDGPLIRLSDAAKNRNAMRAQFTNSLTFNRSQLVEIRNTLEAKFAMPKVENDNANKLKHQNLNPNNIKVNEGEKMELVSEERAKILQIIEDAKRLHPKFR